jgi:hypothetical protein
MQEIKLKLEMAEVNLMLEALGNLPFVRVYALINKIQNQASQQLETNGQIQENVHLKKDKRTTE